MQLPVITVKKIIGLVLLCLVVGFVMRFFGIGPDSFWRWIINLGETLFETAKSILSNGLEYLLVGAAVVVPIYLIIYLSKALRRKP